MNDYEVQITTVVCADNEEEVIDYIRKIYGDNVGITIKLSEDDYV